MKRTMTSPDLGLNEAQLREIYNNPHFNELIKYMDESDPVFYDLPNDQKKLALALVLQGNVNSIEGLSNIFYKRRVPQISEFINQDFIGSNYGFYQEGSLWRRDLEEIFKDTSSIYEWICTGSIGTGKTTVAMLGQFYNLYRVTSLRYPQLAMGSGETKPLALLLLTVSKMKADEMLQGMRVFLKSCKNFIEVNNEDDFEKYNDYPEITPYYEHKVESFPRIQFPNNIYIGTGSNLSHTIGSDIFGVVLDEAEFRGTSAEKTFELYSELLSRVVSRFLKSKFKLVNLISSVKHETGVIATHIKKLKDLINSPYHYISSYAIWEIKPEYLDAFEKYGHFYAFKGTKTHPSRLLNTTDSENYDKGEFHIPENCKVIRVPAHPILKKAFQTNVERALMEQAGEYTSGGERPFDDLSSLEDEVLHGEITFVAPLEGGKSLFNQLPKEMFTKTPDGLRLKRYPNAKRYIHVDLGDTGEAGISMVHKEVHPITGHIMYISDFVGRITSPNRISFQMVQDFLFDLKQIGNIFFRKLTADQYQSVSLLQKLETSKFATEVKKQEMGTKPYPFNEIGTLVGEQSIKVGQCSNLKKQLKGIYFTMNDKGKQTVHYETERKDVADAFVGSIYAAKWCTDDIPVNLYLKELPVDKIHNTDKILKDYKEI